MSFCKLYIFPSFQEKREITFCVCIMIFLNKNNLILYIVCQKPLTQRSGSWGYLGEEHATWWVSIPPIPDDLHRWSLSWNTWVSDEGDVLSQIFWKLSSLAIISRLLLALQHFHIVAACCFMTSWLSFSKVFQIVSGVSWTSLRKDFIFFGVKGHQKIRLCHAFEELALFISEKKQNYQATSNNFSLLKTLFENVKD